jgi:hypothetical protein
MFGRHEKGSICEIFLKLVYFLLNFKKRVISIVFVEHPSRLRPPGRNPALFSAGWM